MDQKLTRDPQALTDPAGGETRLPDAVILNQGSEVGSGAPEDLMCPPDMVCSPEQTEPATRGRKKRRRHIQRRNADR